MEQNTQETVRKAVDNLRCRIERVYRLPNQELSVLYGWPTLHYGEQLFLYVPHMFRVNMTRDLAHLQLSDLQREIRRICRTSVLQGENFLISRM